VGLQTVTKKVLIVSHTLPPVGGAGVQRCSKFIKYLREFGWEPMALTVKNPSVPLFDAWQKSDIPGDCKIFKARTLEPSYKTKRSLFYEKEGGYLKRFLLNLLGSAKNRLLIPDPQISWWPGLALTLFQVAKREGLSCIFVSAPPFSTLMAVTFVGKLFGVPVIVDFRDDWKFYRLHMENAVKTPLAARLDRIFERYVVANCSAITAATSSYLKSVLERNPDINEKKTCVITNGFDEEDFRRFRSPRSSTGRRNASKINFLYSGTVWKATSLFPLVKALELLTLKHPNLSDEIHITVYGRIVEEELRFLNQNRLRRVLEMVDYVPHDEIVQVMMKADVLIVTLSDLQGADQIIPAKTFEYMATGNFILAIVPEGETSRLLRGAYPKSSIVHPNEIEIIAKNISALIADKKLLNEESKADLSEYERKRLTEKLSEVLLSVTD
jgi:glycosyltransferase involved in cell wall biosynthesis